MRLLAIALVLVLASVSFATTRSECYASVEQEASGLHAHNAAQNPSGSITTKTMGCSGTCANTYSNCIAAAENAASKCSPDSSGTYDSCFRVENAAWITCANAEIDCCLAAEKKTCDAEYPADDTTAAPTNPSGENECARDYGPYAQYDARTNSCTCPTDSTFLNKKIHQCVLNTVYAYCEERNAAYDDESDSCICYEGYEPNGNTCRLSDEAGTGGGSISPPGSSGGSSSGSGRPDSGGGCGSAAVLLALLASAFAARG